MDCLGDPALSVEYVEIPIDGLPREFDGFRIAQVSDIHGYRFDPDGREMKAIARAGVDLIAAAGDFVHRRQVEGMERILLPVQGVKLHRGTLRPIFCGADLPLRRWRR